MSDFVPVALTVIFDGNCGMCKRTVKALQIHDNDGRLTFVPCQATSGVERFGVTRRECAVSVWAVAPNGIRYAGGQAAVLIASVLLQTRWPSAVGSLPGVCHGLDWGYRFVARHRGRFPGVTPWCESHPDDCS